MKFASISLALAAIAGSAIAAPDPLYARALEKVNWFERDLDFYPRESGVAVLERNVDGEPVDAVFTRSEYIPLHKIDHSRVARYAETTMEALEIAADQALHAADCDTGRKEHWEAESGKHRRKINDFVTMNQGHDRAANLQDRTNLHDMVHEHERLAKETTLSAKKFTVEAEKAIVKQWIRDGRISC